MIPSSRAGVWPTTVKVQCQNEPVFEATIRFRLLPRRDEFLGREVYRLLPCIDCPTCARGYTLQDDGTWLSDRPLKWIGYS